MVRSVTANFGAPGACEAGQRRLWVRGARKSGLVDSGEAMAGIMALQCKLRARKGRVAAATLTDGARLGEAQGKNAGH